MRNPEHLLMSPYRGGTNGGGAGGLPGGAPGGNPAMGGSAFNGVLANGRTPAFSKTKSISYGTTDQIYSASATVAADAASGKIPSQIEVANNGSVPILVLVGYETYSDETTDVGATRYLHVMLMPGEVYYPSVRAVISTESASTQFDGTIATNAAPHSS